MPRERLAPPDRHRTRRRTLPAPEPPERRGPSRHPSRDARGLHASRPRTRDPRRPSRPIVDRGRRPISRGNGRRAGPAGALRDPHRRAAEGTRRSRSRFDRQPCLHAGGCLERPEPGDQGSSRYRAGRGAGCVRAAPAPLRAGREPSPGSLRSRRAPLAVRARRTRPGRGAAGRAPGHVARRLRERFATGCGRRSGAGRDRRRIGGSRGRSRRDRPRQGAGRAAIRRRASTQPDRTGSPDKGRQRVGRRCGRAGIDRARGAGPGRDGERPRSRSPAGRDRGGRVAGGAQAGRCTAPRPSSAPSRRIARHRGGPGAHPPAGSRRGRCRLRRVARGRRRPAGAGVAGGTRRLPAGRCRRPGAGRRAHRKPEPGIAGRTGRILRDRDRNRLPGTADAPGPSWNSCISG